MESVFMKKKKLLDFVFASDTESDSDTGFKVVVKKKKKKEKESIPNVSIPKKKNKDKKQMEVTKEKTSIKKQKKLSKDPTKKVQLLPHQIDHYNRIQKLFDSGEQFYIDCSLMGAGKTYLAAYFAQQYNLPLFVICPKSMINTWERVSEEYSIPLEFITTYQSLRGTKNKLSHDYLTRIDTSEMVVSKKGNEKIISHTLFDATEKFKQLADKGIFLICDEIQYLKNTTSQAEAAIALTKAIFPNTSSKMAFLSATPFDKQESAVNVIRLANIVRKKELFTSEAFGRNFQLTGFKELQKKCEEVNPDATYSIIQKRNISGKTIKGICFDLYVMILKPKFVSIMQRPIINAKCDTKNGIYKLTAQQTIEMKNAVADLVDSARYSEKKDSIMDGPMNMGGVTKAMQQIEYLKLPIIKRLVRQKLSESENNKVIVYVNYNQTIDSLMQKFQKYTPLKLNGQSSIQDRKSIVTKFQKASSGYRLLIGNTKVGGIGIDLHDTNGGFPRTMFIVPTFAIMDLHQACGRVYRQGTVSDSTIRFIYTKCKELNVINALARKTEVLKNVATDEKSDVKFPGEYLIENESSDSDSD